MKIEVEIEFDFLSSLEKPFVHLGLSMFIGLKFIGYWILKISLWDFNKLVFFHVVKREKLDFRTSKLEHTSLNCVLLKY